MQLKSGVMYLGAVFLAAFLLTAPVHPERIPSAEGVFYYQPAASVFGTEALWINPAALGSFNASGLQLMTELRDDDFGRSWGLAINRERFGVAYRKIHSPVGDDYKEYVFGMGLSLGTTTHIGGSYRYYKDAPDQLHKKHFWNVGLMGGRGKLHWAATFENLNRTRAGDGDRSEIEQRYSLAYRPNGRTLTFSADMFLSTGTKLSNADFIYHVEWATAKGVYMTGSMDSDKNFQVGVRANLLQYFVGNQNNYDRDANHRYSTFYYGASSLPQPSIVNRRARRLSVGIGGSISENPPQPRFGRQPIGFATLLVDIYRAAEDPSIGAMALNLRGLSLGFGQAEELRQAILHFKRRGKDVTCHVSHPNNIGYYVASAADRIHIPPVSQLNLIGLRAELTFYAGTLDKLGIKADIVKIGDYKTAADQYTRTGSSDEHREQVDELLDDLYDQMTAAIAAGRQLPVDSVRKLIDAGPYTSQGALDAGLVDGLSYRDQLKDKVLPRMPEISFRRYLADTLLNDGWPPAPVLALVVADGDIGFGSSGMFPVEAPAAVTPSEMSRAFSRAVAETDTRAVILRINSPGGYALAGEEIHRVISKAREKKPLVVSMSNVAASGGYYLSTPAGAVFANPGTVTGSIGIYAGKPDLSGLYEKIGMSKELYTRGHFAGMYSWARPFSDEERRKYLSQMTAFYEHFLKLVADGRDLSMDSVDALSRGRVWTGRQAVANGLVDKLGGLYDALTSTAEELELDDYRVAIYPRKTPWLVLPGGSWWQSIASFIRSDDGGGALADNAASLLPDGLYTRMPYDISIE